MTIEVGSKLHAQLEALIKSRHPGETPPKIMVMGDSPEIEAIKKFFIERNAQDLADAICIVSREDAEAQMMKSIPMPPPFPSDFTIRDHYEYTKRGSTGRHYHPVNKKTGKPSGNNFKECSPAELAKIREENSNRKAINFRKRLPAGHPDKL